jgi:DNA-binding SARP family transcriptional activator
VRAASPTRWPTEQLVDDARAAAAVARPHEAVAGFREALALWRGPALAEVAASTFATAEAIRLEQSRLTALEDCLAAELACGRHREVTAELEGLVHEHVLRERLWELLMLALYRSGRQPDALRAFQDLRARLGDEVGLDPSPSLMELERAIVAHDPALRWDGAGAVT